MSYRIGRMGSEHTAKSFPVCENKHRVIHRNTFMKETARQERRTRDVGVEMVDVGVEMVDVGVEMVPAKGERENGSRMDRPL